MLCVLFSLLPLFSLPPRPELFFSLSALLAATSRCCQRKFLPFFSIFIYSARVWHVKNFFWFIFGGQFSTLECNPICTTFSFSFFLFPRLDWNDRATDFHGISTETEMLLRLVILFSSPASFPTEHTEFSNTLRSRVASLSKRETTPPGVADWKVLRCGVSWLRKVIAARGIAA